MAKSFVVGECGFVMQIESYFLSQICFRIFVSLPKHWSCNIVYSVRIL